jgi:hypothetical protein
MYKHGIAIFPVPAFTVHLSASCDTHNRFDIGCIAANSAVFSLGRPLKSSGHLPLSVRAS